MTQAVRTMPVPVVQPKQATTRALLTLLGVPCVITAILYVTRVNAVTGLETLLAGVLLALPWWAYLRWKGQLRTSIPLFASVGFAYWIFFALPLFWGDRFRGGPGPPSIIPEPMIQQAMLMAVVGVICLAVGANLGLGERVRLPVRIDLRNDRWVTNYVRVVLIVSAALNLIPSSSLGATSDTQQIAALLQTSIPLIACVILFRLVLRGDGTRFDKGVLIPAYVVSVGITGFASGWLGSLLDVGVALMAVYLWEKRRMPWLAITLALLYVLFYQPGKHQFREQTWYGGQSGGVISRVEEWTQLSLTSWQTALTNPASGALLDNVRLSIMRSSLLQQTAHVVETTPTFVPYQNGSTYSYLLSSWVPRFLWPDKPSVNDANRFYQVAYGLTNAQNLNGVSISVGSLAEAYINFGWVGVVIIMLLLGILFAFVESAFLSETSGGFLSAVGILILLHFIVIESQLAVYLSGILQMALLAIVVFLPALQFRSSKMEAKG